MKGRLPGSHGDLKEASDEELMVAYQKGREEAFMLLYERHSGKVYSFLLTRLRDRVLADDAFQATFLKLHSSRGNYDSVLPFAPWLFTICRTVMIDMIRGRNRVSAREASDEVALEIAAAPVASESVLMPDLSGLPANLSHALELRYKEDLSFEEIAARLNTTPENTRQLVSRAVRKIRKLVQGDRK